MNKINGRILIIGCGAVSQCAIPLILQNFIIDPKNIKVIDPVDNSNKILPSIQKGVIFQINAIEKNNFESILKENLKSGDLCIDLANETDTLDILNWCLTNNVNYLNTSLNQWSGSISTLQNHLMVLDFKKNTSLKTTGVLSHGANPGLVSSFAKQGLIDLAKKVLSTSYSKEIENAIQAKDFPKLAFLLNVKVIHISEIDTQKSSTQRKKNEFFNTWSITELINETISKAEFAWGIHETNVPENSQVKDFNINFKKKALDIKLKSWVPHQEFVGIIPGHDETYSIADFLTIKQNSNFIYRPTVIFVYRPSKSARESLKELKETGFKVPEQHTILKEEINEGTDKMGCLIMSDKYNSFWTGSILDIKDTDQLVYGQNGTVIQVAAGVIAAIDFIINNPNQGVCFPEELDHEQVLKIAKPYLGNFVSIPTTWPENKDLSFKNFLVEV